MMRETRKLLSVKNRWELQNLSTMLANWSKFGLTAKHLKSKPNSFFYWVIILSIKLRHKFYDELLSKILQLPEVKETLKSIKNDDWYKDDYMREECAIEAFFEGQNETLKIPEILFLLFFLFG